VNHGQELKVEAVQLRALRGEHVPIQGVGVDLPPGGGPRESGNEEYDAELVGEAMPPEAHPPGVPTVSTVVIGCDAAVVWLHQEEDGSLLPRQVAGLRGDIEKEVGMIAGLRVRADMLDPDGVGGQEGGSGDADDEAKDEQDLGSLAEAWHERDLS
jgi:hypothetical protein